MSERTKTADAPTPDRAPKVPAAGEAPRPRGEVEILINGVRVAVSPELEEAVQRAYNGLFQTLPAEMTTTQAAAFLDVSRPFVIKLVKQGELPCRMVGKHRRIPTAALAAYREKMFRRAKTAADELAQLSQELGLYDLEGPPPKAP
jgi:excisionase family DNA binding protein